MRFLPYVVLMLAVFLLIIGFRIRDLNHRLERLEEVHQIFEDGSVCHIDPDGPTYCAR